MKTAVSIPDALFRRAEAAARKRRISRSQFYATAISELLERERSQAITDKLNEVYSDEPSRLDPGLKRLQFKSLAKESW